MVLSFWGCSCFIVIVVFYTYFLLICVLGNGRSSLMLFPLVVKIKTMQFYADFQHFNLFKFLPFLVEKKHEKTLHSWCKNLALELKKMFRFFTILACIIGSLKLSSMDKCLDVSTFFMIIYIWPDIWFLLTNCSQANPTTETYL